jgi:hypothetical protein
MKKTITTSFFFIGLCFGICAQNLVPNYSFEAKLTCITGGDEFTGYVADWEGGGDLSYFTSLCNEKSDSVPLNFTGYQYAHTGNAYAGIFTYSSDTVEGPSAKNFRSYIQAQLTDSLTAKKKYYVTFYVSLADSCWYYCNNIGAYFSDSSLNYVPSFNYVKPYLIPQVANDPINNPLNNPLIWEKISGSFIAKGGEQYIIIGNYNFDSTSTIGFIGRISSDIPNAFYYVDDVIVSPDSNYADSLMGVAQLKVNSEEIKVFPNPSNGVFTIQSSVVSHKSLVEIYNIFGQPVYKAPLPTETTQVNLSAEPKGIYLYRVITDDGNLASQGKLVIQ